MKKIILVGAISALTTLSAQADYQFEANVGYIRGDVDFDFDFDFDVDNVDFDGYTLAATAFLESVDTSKGPLSEASFLDKSSNISIAFSTTEFDDVDNDVSAISGRYVLSQDFIVEAGYTDLDSDTSFTIGFGKYLTNSSDILISYTKFDNSDANLLDLAFHSVNDLTGPTSIAYDLGASYIDADDETGFRLNAGLTYYPTKQLGLGISGSYSSIEDTNDTEDTDDTDITKIELGAEYFFNENVAGSLAFSTQDNSDGFGSVTVDTFTLAMTARF